MEYYLIKADTDYTDVPVVESWFDRIDVRDMKRARASRLPERELLFLQGNPHTTFTDILFRPFLLVSEKMQEVITLYEPDTIFKEIVLLDTVNQLAELYFCPVLHKVDCLTEQSEFNLDGSVIKKAIINVSKTGDKSVFLLAGVQGFQAVGRLDFIESLLRRDIRGLTLTPIETIDEVMAMEWK